MNTHQGPARTYAPPLERRIRKMAEETGRTVDEAKSWLEMIADKIVAEEHFEALDDAPYVLCLNGRLVCAGLEAWDQGALRFYFTDNPTDPFPAGALEPREGGWMPEPAWVPARRVLREIACPSVSASVGQLDKTATPCDQYNPATTQTLW